MLFIEVSIFISVGSPKHDIIVNSNKDAVPITLQGELFEDYIVQEKNKNNLHRSGTKISSRSIGKKSKLPQQVRNSKKEADKIVMM